MPRQGCCACSWPRGCSTLSFTVAHRQDEPSGAGDHQPLSVAGRCLNHTAAHVLLAPKYFDVSSISRMCQCGAKTERGL